MAEDIKKRSPLLLVSSLFLGITLLAVVATKLEPLLPDSAQEQAVPTTEQPTTSSEHTSTSAASGSPRWIRSDSDIAALMGCELPQHVNGQAVITRYTCTDEQMVKYRAYWNGGDTSPH